VKNCVLKYQNTLIYSSNTHRHTTRSATYKVDGLLHSAVSIWYYSVLSIEEISDAKKQE